MKQRRKQFLDDVELAIINAVDNFTMDDWTEMRTKSYWLERDTINNPRERNIYILECIREYKRR